MTLYPRANASRTVLDLNGIWDFRLRETDAWTTMAVPASYNDQKADPAYRAHVGLVWYRTRITVPSVLRDQRRFLRFDAVTHDARVFIDGKLLCEHKGGFLPFEAEITDAVKPGATAELTVEVDNRINHGTLPVGNEGGIAFFGSDNPGIPSVEAGKLYQQQKGINLPNFDFFNYAGINRPVRLFTTPQMRITDITVIGDMYGRLTWRIETEGEG